MLLLLGKSNVTHAAVLIGAERHQGVRCYRILNSWGDAFADHGKIRILVDGILTNRVSTTIVSPFV